MGNNRLTIQKPNIYPKKKSLFYIVNFDLLYYNILLLENIQETIHISIEKYIIFFRVLDVLTIYHKTCSSEVFFF